MYPVLNFHVPQPILLHILSFLSLDDLERIQSVCTRWKKLIEQNFFTNKITSYKFHQDRERIERIKCLEFKNSELCKKLASKNFQHSFFDVIEDHVLLGFRSSKGSRVILRHNKELLLQKKISGTLFHLSFLNPSHIYLLTQSSSNCYELKIQEFTEEVSFFQHIKDQHTVPVITNYFDEKTERGWVIYSQSTQVITASADVLEERYSITLAKSTIDQLSVLKEESQLGCLYDSFSFRAFSLPCLMPLLSLDNSLKPQLSISNFVFSSNYLFATTLSKEHKHLWSWRIGQPFSTHLDSFYLEKESFLETECYENLLLVKSPQGLHFWDIHAGCYLKTFYLQSKVLQIKITEKKIFYLTEKLEIYQLAY